VSGGCWSARHHRPLGHCTTLVDGSAAGELLSQACSGRGLEGSIKCICQVRGSVLSAFYTGVPSATLAPPLVDAALHADLGARSAAWPTAMPQLIAGPNPRGRCLQQRAEWLYTTSATCCRVFAVKPGKGDLEGPAAEQPKGSSTCSSGGGRSGPAAGQPGAQSLPSHSVSSSSLLSGSSGGRPACAALPRSGQSVLDCDGNVADPPQPPAATVGCEPAAEAQSMQPGRSALQAAPASQARVAQRRPAPLSLHGLSAPRDHIFDMATAQLLSQPQPHARQQAAQQHLPAGGHARRHASKPPLHRASRLSMVGTHAPIIDSQIP